MDNNTPMPKGESIACVDSKQSVYGRWINEKDEWPECPRCGFWAREDEYSGNPMVSNFCPDCGLQLISKGRPTLGRDYCEVKKAIHLRRTEGSYVTWGKGNTTTKTIEKFGVIAPSNKVLTDIAPLTPTRFEIALKEARKSYSLGDLLPLLDRVVADEWGEVDDEAMQTNAQYTRNLPHQLNTLLNRMEKAWIILDAGKNCPLWDGLYCELHSEINIAELAREITTEQANYFRERYLRIDVKGTQKFLESLPGTKIQLFNGDIITDCECFLRDGIF